jgi:hypothetical protein
MWIGGPEMGRKLALVVSATVLPVLLVCTVGVGVASAHPVFPGSVTCNAGSGVWSGSVTFTPPLSFSGAATHEVVKVVAKLGNTTSPCLTSSTPPAGSKVIGLIKGKAKFSGTAANNCAFIFSGSSNTPVAAAFLMRWLTPAGAPTKWIAPPVFSFVGAANYASITVTGGHVLGSFSPNGNPIAVLSAPSWPGTTGAVATGCSSTGGLHSLPLSTSSGTW